MDTKRRHLLVQLALTADSQRVQVLIVEATSTPGLWEVDRSRVAYASVEDFDAAVAPIVAAASAFNGNVNVIPLCSHRPQAGIAIHVPHEIELVRNPPCPGGASSVEAGKLVIAAAERMLGEKIERAVDFD